ncbi:MAG TPA: alpha/beta fold hydrolase [Pseudonocardiaceae bacterium]|nr:alpha/beta fold hydrolase [Pseudonocardiaceae bacterium]
MTQQDDRDRWIRSFHPTRHSPVQLVCLPHAGGSASYYHPMSADLAKRGVDTLIVQYPGRQDRRTEPALTTIAELADGVTDALTGRSDLPIVLFGHSMGAVVAFETARRLERAGTPVATVLVSGRRGPTATRTERWVHQMPDGEVVGEIKLLDGTAGELLDDPEMLELVMPAIRADHQAIETYVAETGALVHCPLTALVGDADPKTTPEEARAWSVHTTDRFDLRVFPGGHFYVADQRAAVVATIMAEISR